MKRISKFGGQITLHFFNTCCCMVLFLEDAFHWNLALLQSFLEILRIMPALSHVTLLVHFYIDWRFVLGYKYYVLIETVL